MMVGNAVQRVPRWILAVLISVVITGGLGAILLLSSTVLPERLGPPIEELVVEGVILSPDSIQLSVRNAGPDPVRVAQVSVNDSFVDVTGGEAPIPRLRATTLRLQYPWQPGLPYHVDLLTSTGAVIDHEIPVAVETPGRGAKSLGRMAVIGTFIGVVPVLLGMCVLPLLRRSGPTVVRVLLAVTVGLLGFLAADAFIEGLDGASLAAPAFGGPVLLMLGAACAFLALTAIGTQQRGPAEGPRLALLVAFGIGLHNLSEGLAVGSAFAVGELAVGATLMAGFAAHNVTEGMAVVAPLGGQRIGTVRLLSYGFLAGAPAILGTVVGSTITAPALVSFLLGLGIGAIIQVIVQLAPSLRARSQAGLDAPAIGGLATGIVIMYATSLLITA